MTQADGKGPRGCRRSRTPGERPDPSEDAHAFERPPAIMDILRGTGPRRADTTRTRDFLHQRRLVALRPFVTDDGVPGLCLRLDGDDMIALRLEGSLLDVVLLAISRLKASLGPKR